MAEEQTFNYMVNVDLEDGEKELKVLERNLVSLTNHFEKTEQSVEDVEKEIRRLRASGRSFDHLETKANDLRSDMDRTTRSIITQRKALNSLRGGISGINVEASSATGGTSMLSNGLGSVTTGLQGVASAAGPAGIALAATIGIAAGGAAIFAKLGGAISDLNEQFQEVNRYATGAGESVEDVLALIRAGERAGVEIDPGSLFDLRDRRQQAIEDVTSEAAVAFEALGVGATTSSIDEIITALNNFENETLATQYAVDILGEEMASRVRVIGEITEAERIAAEEEAARAEEIKGAAEAFNTFNQQLNDTKNSFLVGIAPAIERLSESLGPILDDVALWLQYSPDFEAFSDNVVDFLGTIGEIFKALLGIDDAELEQYRKLQSIRREANKRIRQEEREKQAADRKELFGKRQAAKDEAEAAEGSSEAAKDVEHAIEGTGKELKPI